MDDAIPRSIVLVILIIAGGFFAGAETAFSFTNTVRLRMLAENSRKAKRAVRIIDDFDMTIVTLLIVINVVHIAASAIATSLFIDITGSSALGPVLATVVITLAIFIFSETIPKNFAKTNSDAYALAVSLPIRALTLALYPLAWLLTGLGTLVKKIFRLRDDELFEPEETEIIRAAIEFGDTKVSEIMTPREDIVGISVKADEEEIKNILIEEKFSRFPVYRGGINNIVGVVRANQALWKMIKDDEDFVIRENMTKPMFCSPDDGVNEIFERMCNRKNHFAVVRGEDGRTAGIITMEDILEEIVGEIYDEDDYEETEGRSDE